jgi:RNase adapter protein RapZ
VTAQRPSRGLPDGRTRAGRRTAVSHGATGAKFIVLTGLSGSGKSQAIRALEDLGYFCIDNLPTMLIPTLAELSLRAGSALSRVAMVVDVREGSFLVNFPKEYRKLRALHDLNPALIFLEANDRALLRRFSETRRPHPLAHDRSVMEGIRAERRQLRAIRKLADQIVDTSDLTVHELREIFSTVSRGHEARRPMVLTVLSFGFKHGLPPESDLVFDVRCLPNPHFVPRLRERTGRDRPVVRYMEQHSATAELLKRLTDLLEFLIPQYVDEGKSYLTVAIGCTGGRHRSVMIAEAIKRATAGLEDVRVRVRHRDIERSND